MRLSIGEQKFRAFHLLGYHRLFCSIIKRRLIYLGKEWLMNGSFRKIKAGIPDNAFLEFFNSSFWGKQFDFSSYVLT